MSTLLEEATMKKLTPRQQDVVDKMKQGWWLGRPVKRPSALLFNGTTGYSERIHFSTYLSLLRNGIVKVTDKKAFPTLHHELTDDYA